MKLWWFCGLVGVDMNRSRLTVLLDCVELVRIGIDFSGMKSG